MGTTFKNSCTLFSKKYTLKSAEYVSLPRVSYIIIEDAPPSFSNVLYFSTCMPYSQVGYAFK